ncbi:MAG: hypothetical protein CEE38_19575 [Planctomycetes bacterium B3_Pla]|nr:MAG: hypothetical protein CEE38_19575 [Planctomycetes bacterium B3_Pla]
MKKQVILLAAVVLFCAAGLVQAQEDPLGVTADATWVSKYLWYGFDLLDDKGAFQPSVDVDLFGSGFSLNVWSSYPTAVGDMNKGGGAAGTSRVDATEFDYTLAYSTVICEGEPHATYITAQGIYYDFIDIPSQAADAEEIGVQLTWPNVSPTGDVTPGYYISRIWPAKSGKPRAGKDDLIPGDYAGWIHVFSLGYDLTVPGLLPETPEQTFNLSVATVYNDGFAGGTVDHDWSHAVFGASTDFELAENFNVTPGIYYQSSWDDTVNSEDELWISLGASYKF